MISFTLSCKGKLQSFTKRTRTFLSRKMAKYFKLHIIKNLAVKMRMSKFQQYNSKR